MNCAKVLIVDDEPFARQTIAEWLRGKNFNVFEAESGPQAMERIQKDNMDIVISDMVMPGMDGLQLLKKAKATKADVSFPHGYGVPVARYRDKSHAGRGIGLSGKALHARGADASGESHADAKGSRQTAWVGQGHFPGGRDFSGHVDAHHRGTFSPSPLTPSEEKSNERHSVSRSGKPRPKISEFRISQPFQHNLQRSRLRLHGKQFLS